MEYMIAERINIQTKIEQLRKRTTIQTNKIILTKCLYAWKQHKQNKQQKTQLNVTQQIVPYKPPMKTIKPENDTYEKWKHIMALKHIHNQIHNGRWGEIP